MGFVSDVSAFPLVENFAEHTPANIGRGLILRDYSKQPRGSIPHAKPDKAPMLSWQEIREITEEKERKKERLIDLCDANGVVAMDQGQTNFCWCYAPVKGVAIQRLKQGEPYVELAPESVAGPSSNYKNMNGRPVGVGGWGGDSIRFIVEDGIAPRALWAAHKIAPSMNTAAVEASRKFYRGVEFYDLGRDNYQGLCSCVALDIPVALGVDDWGHEILVIALALDARGNILGIFDNSWGRQWGNNGRGVLVPSRMRGDGVAVATVSSGTPGGVRGEQKLVVA